MQHVKKSALVPYSCSVMFDLVTDIHAYPEFIRWCSSAEVLESDVLENKVLDNVETKRVIAKLDITYNGLKKSFTTENTNIKDREIRMQLHSNKKNNKNSDNQGSSHKLFRFLQGGWYFTDLGEGTKVELDMQFDMASPLLRKLVSPVFNQIVGGQLDAFVARAHALAKKGS